TRRRLLAGFCGQRVAPAPFPDLALFVMIRGITAGVKADGEQGTSVPRGPRRQRRLLLLYGCIAGVQAARTGSAHSGLGTLLARRENQGDQASWDIDFDRPRWQRSAGIATLPGRLPQPRAT